MPYLLVNDIVAMYEDEKDGDDKPHTLAAQLALELSRGASDALKVEQCRLTLNPKTLTLNPKLKPKP
jgi:hypothetical protein